MSSLPCLHAPAKKRLADAMMRKLFEELGEELARTGERIEIALYGGAAIVLSFGFRESTMDADFVRISGNPLSLDRCAKRLAVRYGLASDWLNDSVSIFTSDTPDLKLLGDFPRKGRAGLRIFTASAQYLFAMKCLAMRDMMTTSDAHDVWDLADLCGVKTVEGALEMFERFYPLHSLPRRNRLLLEDVFEAKTVSRSFSREYFW